MSDATVIPTWMAIAVAGGTPLLTFGGVLLANWASRKGAVETEKRSKREETMRNLRWAAELAVGDDEQRSALGVSQLIALESADMLDEEQAVFVRAALDTVLSEPESALDELGEEVVVEVSAAGHIAWEGTAAGEAPALDLAGEDGGNDG